jgi:single-stranded-DNA-specific exonuclease
LGTVADIVPILEENRILVKAGLEVLASCIRPGTNALKEVSGLSNSAPTSWDIAFKLAPRINAAGRVVHANTSIDLLTAPDSETALPVARFLNETNSRRQQIEKDILDEAIRILASNPGLLRQKSLVLCGEAWNEGVIGIVASKLVTRYYRPVVLISVKNGIGKGSARSIAGFNLKD